MSSMSESICIAPLFRKRNGSVKRAPGGVSPRLCNQQCVPDNQKQGVCFTFSMVPDSDDSKAIKAERRLDKFMQLSGGLYRLAIFQMEESACNQSHLCHGYVVMTQCYTLNEMARVLPFASVSFKTVTHTAACLHAVRHDPVMKRTHGPFLFGDDSMIPPCARVDHEGILICFTLILCLFNINLYERTASNIKNYG